MEVRGMVTKPKYYYSKYTSNPLYSITGYSLSWLFRNYASYNEGGYSSYTFDPSNGKVATSGSYKFISGGDPSGTSVYNSSGSEVLKYQVEYASSYGRNHISIYGSSVTTVLSIIGYSRGSIVQSDIVAFDGEYPANGRHSDGYWYVKGNMVNNIPTLTLKTADNTPITENKTFTIPLQTNHIFNVTANDEDADQTLQYKVSVGGVNAIPLTSIEKDTETAVMIDKSNLIVGMNAVVVTVRDSEGGETSFQFNIIVDANMPIDASCLANMKFNGYSLSTISLAELVNHLE